MNCRVKTPFLATAIKSLPVVVFVLCLVATDCGHTQPATTEGPTNSAGPQGERLSSYPTFIFNMMTRFSKWQPDPLATDACKLSFSSEKLDPHVCEANYKMGLIESFQSRLFIQFDMTDLSRFQKIDFQLKPDLKIRGLLALHPKEKRPLVIFRMGIHGNVDEFLAERFLAKIIYEDLGYNFLALESLTSHGFLTLNKHVTIGGVEEGLHTFYIINQIANNEFPWTQNITDLHLMGVSMAGSGVFLATYLDEQYQHKLKSVQVFCPLINMELTFKHHELRGFQSAFVDLWNRRRLIQLLELNPKLNDVNWWLTIFDWKPRFTPAALNWLDETGAQPLLDLQTFKAKFPAVRFPKEFEKHVTESKSLYKLNDFWSFYKNEKTPIHVVVTPTDLAVVNDLNTDMIRKHQQPGNFLKTDFQDLRGFHCALAPEYQWPFLVEVVRRGLQ